MWVVLGLLAAHPAWGVTALPLLARLYVRANDLPGIPPKHRPPVLALVALGLSEYAVRVSASEVKRMKSHDPALTMEKKSDYTPPPDAIKKDYFSKSRSLDVASGCVLLASAALIVTGLNHRPTPTGAPMRLCRLALVMSVLVTAGVLLALAWQVPWLAFIAFLVWAAKSTKRRKLHACGTAEFCSAERMEQEGVLADGPGLCVGVVNLPPLRFWGCVRDLFRKGVPDDEACHRLVTAIFTSGRCPASPRSG